MGNVKTAQIDLSIPAGSGFSNLQNLDANRLVSMTINLVMIIAVILFFFMLLFGGIRWMLSGGDQGRVDAAKSQIISALVGLTIVFSVYAISQFIGVTFGVDILSGLQFP